MSVEKYLEKNPWREGRAVLSGDFRGIPGYSAEKK
jgi:hypothetical protein